MGFLFLTGDACNRTAARAETAANALFGVDFVDHKVFAFACAAFFIVDMFKIFIAEMSYRR